jgi:ribosomal protein L37AE/L43A
MVLKSLFGRLGGDSTTEEELEPPSHVCQSCGEKYFTNRDVEIKQCRACGGVRVEAV